MRKTGTMVVLSFVVGALLQLLSMLSPVSASLSFHSKAALQMSQSISTLQGLGPSQCQYLPGLTSSQKAWCRHHYVFMQPIAQGTRLGLDECSRQFRYQRWNCPVNNTDAIVQVLGLRTAETAFLQSIQSAGMMQAVARVCSRGNVTDFCGCDDAPGFQTGRVGHISASATAVNADKSASDSGKFVWGGCGDNVDTGYRFGREFLGDEDIAQPSDAGAQLMAQQNHEAGRQAVKVTVRRTCKCIGLTGACTRRICWRSLPTIQVVGEVLMEHYRNARQVKVKSKKNTLKLAPLDRDEGGKTRIADLELTYMRPSPNFCHANSSVGISGTRGRECQELSTGDDGCELLCCGRGYYAKRTVSNKKCRCRFFWCCKVVCEQCITAKETFHCN